MNDLISRQELIDRCDDVIENGASTVFGLHPIAMEAVKYVVENMPFIDAVEVIRCKDCANWQIDWIPTIGGDKGCHYCEMFDSSTEPLNYCGYAERRAE